MWAYRLIGPLRFERISVARPTPDDLPTGEVIVRLRVGGICGSDLPEARGLVQTRTPASGLGPLHEIVGDVIASAGDRIRVGQRVVGWVRDEHGLSQDAIAEQSRLQVVPDDLSDVEAVVAQPLACVLCAVDRFGEVSGQRAVVLGQGTIGLMFDQVAGPPRGRGDRRGPGRSLRPGRGHGRRVCPHQQSGMGAPRGRWPATADRGRGRRAPGGHS